MGGNYSRRRFLGAGVAAGLVPVLGRARPATTGLSNTLEVISDGGGVAAYEFAVTGDVDQRDDDDRTSENRAYGHLGPKRGIDTFEYSGELSGLTACGPASVYRNGVRIRPATLPAPAGELTAGDFDVGPGTNVVRIESDGGGVAAYEFEVTGSLAQRDWDDQVTGGHAYGHVGPARGADEFEFTGAVTRFELAGPASVVLDGSEVTPGTNDGDEPTLVRAGPGREAAVVPGTRVLFEAVVPALARTYLRGEWYVDGRRRVGPDAFHGQVDGLGGTAFTTEFESEGTHTVRVEVSERDRPDEDDAVGSMEWTVDVGPDGNRPPTVERLRPETDAVVVGESSERREFAVEVRDPEGALDRVVWWTSQCDAVVDVSHVAGASDTATVTFAPDVGCPLQAWAVDDGGALVRFPGWVAHED